ncbi:MAG: hypothetical protein K2Q23_07835, partial [Bryobacteraceae bacterium]|nr:hypothetical protein [Bryobacteraceae bacterium]
MVFRYQRLSFRFRALDPVSFPPLGAANAIRGVMGAYLRETGCSAECLRPEACPQPGNCPYTRIFEPTAPAGSPSGLAQPPRPFVLRPRLLDGRSFAPSEEFSVELNWFAVRQAGWISDVVRAFQRVERKGISAGRGRARLVGTETSAPLELPVVGCSVAAHCATVQFLSPTELKSGSAVVAQPDFPVLVARARDRLSTLA